MERHSKLRRWLSLVGLVLFASHAVADESTLHVLPGKITLSGRDAIQHLIVEMAQNDRFVSDLTDAVVWQSSDLGVLHVEGNVARPVGNGTATLTATSDSGVATARVRVRDMDVPTQWEFRRHVLPVLSRNGCNTGACHGALAGKGGFKLSLRGYNPIGDYQAITRDARGRRVELSDPGRSLILMKPTTAIRHKGGHRFDTTSRDYRVLAGWIVGGAKPPLSSDSKLVALTVTPDDVRLKPGDRQRLMVAARYEDGREEDVTPWARFSSSDETVAKVDANGVMNVVGPGDGAIVVWFSSQIVLARITVPFANHVADDVFAKAPRRNYIDELNLAKLRELDLAPSARAGDSEFLRRAFLDTVGMLPTNQEVSTFLDDHRHDKRDRVIEDLLGRPEFVDYWTHRWSDLFLVNGRRLRPKAVKSYYMWIRQHVTDNTPWDRVVREVITAKGSSVENGATNFYSLHQDPETMTENISQAFLGLSIGCAKCHNHPLEKWTNDQYYSMASFFSRVKAKGWGGDARSGDGVRTLFAAAQGELIQPLTGVARRPAPLDGEPLPRDSNGDRREYLADWLTAGENPYFSRAIANRIWAAFFGMGIVEPVDDLRVSNPARNDALLDSLSERLVEREFDLKSLMRDILQSETYQRSSRPTANNQDDRHYFSRCYPRRLSAEVLLDGIAQVTQVPSQFTQIGYDGNDFEKTSEYPTGTRAVQLYDSAVVSSFLKTFGRNERDITCECERSNTPSMVQVLHISNGVTINERLQNEGSCVQTALSQGTDSRQIVERAFLSALARMPTPEELDGLASIIDDAPAAEKADVIEDLYWGVMSSREFLFNH